MLNWSLGLGGILGITLAVSGVGLYLLRTLRPTLARDQDIFFAAIALLCGGILVFQSWRLDPILQFAQFLSGASAIWFAVEAIRLRGITTEQAKRTGSAPPMVDDERPVSRVYRAELDELTPLEDQRTSRRIRGGQSNRDDDWEGTRRSPRRDTSDYPTETPRRSRGSLNGSPMVDEDEPSSRRPRAARPLPPDRSTPTWDDDKPARRPRLSDAESSSSRPKRTRPESSTRRRSSESSDYVDYQPVDHPESGGSRDYD
jgi:Ycf66 protein N-terminus